MLVADAVGIQTPRFIHTPANTVRNEAPDAIQLVAEAGMPLDPWQEIALETMLGVRPDGGWAASSASITIARQNGKGAILEARELAGLYLFEESRIVHSAHQAATADEAFKRMRNIIESVPWLDSEVSKILASPGRQSIKLRNGCELSYRTRTRGGGRGFSAPLVILDEAQELTGDQIAAILPLVSSYASHQVLYTGTVLAGASVFQGVVERVRKKVGAALGGAEWSAPDDAASDDVEALLQANPSVGYRMTLAAILNELETFTAAGAEDKFREERMSIWPDVASQGSIIPGGLWAEGETAWRPGPDQLVEHVGVATSVDGAWSSVGVAFRHEDRTYVEVVKHEAGTAWVIPYVAGLVERRRAQKVLTDQGGPASRSLGNGLQAVLPLGVYEETKTAQMQEAVATFVDAVTQGRVEHPGQAVLTAAALGVKEKLVADIRMYDRRKSPVVVAPIEAVTLAAWGLLPDPKAKPFFVVNLNDF